MTLKRSIRTDGRLRLWTIQNLEAWKRFQRRGMLRANGRRVIPEFRFAYQWMVEQMQKRLQVCSGRYPIWAWLSPKPDLRRTAHLPSGQKAVRIECSVPQERVLVSGHEVWTVVLNQGYLSLTEEEDLDWERQLPSDGLRYDQLPAHRQEQVRKSWERIFDLEALDASDWIGPARCIQATLDYLHFDEVLSVREFTAR